MSARGPRELVVFAEAFGRHPSSIQHLVRAMARLEPGLRVLWVELPQRSPQFALRDFGRAVQRLGAMRGGRVAGGGASTASDLVRLAPPALPWRSPAPLARLSDRVATVFVRRALQRHGFVAPAGIVVLPAAAGVAVALGLRPLVFYRADDFALWPGVDPAAVRRDEASLLARAELVVAPAAHLLPRGARRELLLPHAIDPIFVAGTEVASRARSREDAGPPTSAAFAAPLADPLRPTVGAVSGLSVKAAFAAPLADLPRPRLLFAGLIDDRLDFDLLVSTLDALPAAQLVLLGPCALPARRLPRHPRLVIRPAVGLDELPRWLHAAEVLLLPYRRTPLGNSLAPLKLRECIATGVPVVATALPEAVGLGRDLVRIGDGSFFTDAVRDALREPAAARAARAHALAAETWDDRAARLLEALTRLGL